MKPIRVYLHTIYKYAYIHVDHFIYMIGNAFFRMYFAENSAFGKILKSFLRSNYAERNVFGWYFRECILLIK